MITKEACISLDEAYKVYSRENSSENLNILIESGSKLIHHFMKLYGMQNYYEDLFQAGTEGLLKALKRYDSQNGASFTTYAGSLIIGEIRHFVRKETAYYKPKVVAALQEKANCIIEDKFSSTGEFPTIDTIAKKLNIKEDGIGEVMKTGLVPLDEVDFSKIASARHESFKLPVEDRILLEQALNKLNELQRKVIDMLFFKDMTQEQAAKSLDIHQRKVSRIMHAGLSSLKKNWNIN